MRGSVPASIAAVSETPVWSTFLGSWNLEQAGWTEVHLDPYIPALFKRITYPSLDILSWTSDSLE